MTGTVFDIKEFAVFDGPGIRTTVFMKGCPLRCRWCHNPEGLSAKPQLMVSTAACVHCGACQRVCRHPEGCVSCGECTAACRYGFRKISGVKWESAALAERVLRGREFFGDGGGVTFSGGEPLMQWPFVREVIRRMPGIHIAIETSGYASDEVFDEMRNTVGLVMMDWKVSDPDAFRFWTGADQEPVRRHMEALCAGNTPFIVRMPVIPGVNDRKEHFETLAEMAAGAKSLLRVELLPYQRAAGAKYAMVGMDYQPGFDESPVPRMFPEVFEQRGIPVRQFR